MATSRRLSRNAHPSVDSPPCRPTRLPCPSRGSRSGTDPSRRFEASTSTFRGRARRAARPERRRKVDARQDRLRPRAPDRGHGARSAGRRPEARGAAGPRLPRRALPLPGWMSADEVLALHQRLARSTGGAASEASCSRWSALPTLPAVPSRRCRRACSSGSGSRRRSSASPGSCCSTSPRAHSTLPDAARCGSCSRSCGARHRRAAQLAPPQRGRARLRPRRNHLRRRTARRGAPSS